MRHWPLRVVHQGTADAEVHAVRAGIMVHAGILSALQMPPPASSQRQVVVQPVPLKQLAGIEIPALTAKNRLVNALTIGVNSGFLWPCVTLAATLRLLFQPLGIPRTRNIERTDKIRRGIGVFTGLAALWHHCRVAQPRLPDGKRRNPFPKCRVRVGRSGSRFKGHGELNDNSVRADGTDSNRAADLAGSMGFRPFRNAIHQSVVTSGTQRRSFRNSPLDLSGTHVRHFGNAINMRLAGFRELQSTFQPLTCLTDS